MLARQFRRPDRGYYVLGAPGAMRGNRASPLGVDHDFGKESPRGPILISIDDAIDSCRPP